MPIRVGYEAEQQVLNDALSVIADRHDNMESLGSAGGPWLSLGLQVLIVLELRRIATALEIGRDEST